MGIIPWLIMMRMRAAEHAKKQASNGDDGKKAMRLRLQMAEFMRKQNDKPQYQYKDPFEQSDSFLEGGF